MNGLPVTDCSEILYDNDLIAMLVLVLKGEFDIDNPDIRLWVFSHYH